VRQRQLAHDASRDPAPPVVRHPRPHHERRCHVRPRALAGLALRAMVLLSRFRTWVAGAADPKPVREAVWLAEVADGHARPPHACDTGTLRRRRLHEQVAVEGGCIAGHEADSIGERPARPRYQPPPPKIVSGRAVECLLPALMGPPGEGCWVPRERIAANLARRDKRRRSRPINPAWRRGSNLQLGAIGPPTSVVGSARSAPVVTKMKSAAAGTWLIMSSSGSRFLYESSPGHGRIRPAGWIPVRVARRDAPRAQRPASESPATELECGIPAV